MNSLLAKRLTSLFLSLTLIITSTNYIAKDVNAKGKEKDKKEVTVVKELVDERTENSNTYLLSDGSKRAEIFTENIRYREGNSLVEYDNELVEPTAKDKRILKDCDEEKYSYVNKSSNSKVFLPDNLDGENGVLLCYGKYSLEMTPLVETDNYTDSNNDNDNDNDAGSDNEDGNMTYTSEEKGSTITYKSEDDSIKYQYDILNNGIKENIILDKKPETNVFKFKIDDKNLYLKQRKNDRGILVCDKKTDKVIGNVEAPFLRDDNGNEDYESVEYVLENNTNGETILTTKVKEEYFENEGIDYPVNIDPTLVWQFDYITTAGVWSSSIGANTTYTSNPLTVSNSLLDSYPYVGTEHRIYLDTTNMLTGSSLMGNGLLIEGKYIESATLNICEGSIPTYYPSGGTLNIKRVLGTWSPSTITWNTQPSIDSEVIADTELTGELDEHHSLNITKYAQGIADGKYENKGLVFTCPNAHSAANIYGPTRNYVMENGQIVTSRHMSIYLTYRDWEDYDASINIDGSYDEQGDKINVSIEDENELAEGVSVSGFKIFTRRNNGDRFKADFTGQDISDGGDISVSDIENLIDIRAAVLYSDGTVKASNILTFEKGEKETEAPTTTPETESTTVEATTAVETTADPNAPTEAPTEPPINRPYTFKLVNKDTDGDGLEDGYEIWDFKTNWNTETSNSTPEDPEYVLDTDGDGFSDAYEVIYERSDPAVAEDFSEMNKDNDNYNDLQEYNNGTDPYLSDSDFDGINDSGDSQPRKTESATSQTNGNSAYLFDGSDRYIKREIKTEDGVTETTISHAYKDITYSVEYNYGNNSILNKRLKYYYDSKGNNTAVVEQQLNGDTYGTKTIVITYTYDNNGNNIFICDQATRYNMDYDNDGNMTDFDVDGLSLISSSYSNLVNNAGNDGNIDNLEVGDVISKDRQVDTYGNDSVNNPQKVKKDITTYKVENTLQTATKTEIFYNNDNSSTYETNLNKDGKVLSIYDYSSGHNNPVVYEYTYDGNNQTIERSDGFTKEISEYEDTDNNKTVKATSYTFDDIKNQETSYTTSVEEPINVGENETPAVKTVLFNNDYYNLSKSSDGKVYTGVLKSNLYNDRTIYTATSTEVNSTSSTYSVDIYGTGDKSYSYTYDMAGNITSISESNSLIAEYSYDAHGRLMLEKDYQAMKYVEYEYNTTGNIYNKAVYDMNSNGNKISATLDNNYCSYKTDSSGGYKWPDQLRSFDGHSISYDNCGNPIDYWNGMEFTWTRGRVLETIEQQGESDINYTYNKDNLRISKDSSDEEIYYEWDDDRLIKELVKDKSNNKWYEVWYFYSSDGEILGFEYSYVNSNGNKECVRIYYEKNQQGDVVALLDSSGNEIATYTYDAWGNVTSHSVNEGWSRAYFLNHIKYRGYYLDNETGFYYLQSRYYDSVTGRFINADDMYECGFEGDSVYKDNLYIYGNSNPVMNIDINGRAAKKKSKKPVIYILYYSNSKSGFKSQAKKLFYCRGKKNIVRRGVRTRNDFIKEWNNITGNVDEIFLLLHGEPGKLYFEKSESFPTKKYNFRALKSKKVNKKIYLLSCSGGAGGEGNNLAWSFAKLSDSKVRACEVKVSYTKVLGYYYARPSHMYNSYHILDYYYIKKKKTILIGPQLFKTTEYQAVKGNRGSLFY